MIELIWGAEPRFTAQPHLFKISNNHATCKLKANFLWGLPLMSLCSLRSPTMYKVTTFQVTRSYPAKDMANKEQKQHMNAFSSSQDLADDKTSIAASMNHPQQQHSHPSQTSGSPLPSPSKSIKENPVVGPLTLSYALDQVLSPGQNPLSPRELAPHLYRKPPCPHCQAAKEGRRIQKWKRFGLSWIVSKKKSGR